MAYVSIVEPQQHIMGVKVNRKDKEISAKQQYEGRSIRKYC
jgi:hypothetical protein